MRLLLASLCVLFATSAAAQTADPGRLVYASRCAGCHGSNGGGGELGPSIVARVPARTDEDLTTVIRQGLPTAGMPAFGEPRRRRSRRPHSLFAHAPSARRIGARSHHARAHNRRDRWKVWCSIRASTTCSCSETIAKSICCGRSGDRYRPVTSQTDWPSYNGQTTGSRYSPLTQINKSNVGRLVPKWMFSLPNTPPLQVTPVVVDGVMYVTSANQCYALDAGIGTTRSGTTRARGPEGSSATRRAASTVEWRSQAIACSW